MDCQLVLEPVSLSNSEWGRVADFVAKNYKNSCIVRIEHVLSRNREDYENMLRKLKIEDIHPKDRDSKFPICEMFHGTKEKIDPFKAAAGHRIDDDATSVVAVAALARPTRACTADMFKN